MAHLAYYNYVKDSLDIFYDSHVNLIEKVCLELNQMDKKDILIEKLLDKNIKLKAKKDVNAPKRWRTNFILYSDEFRNSVISENKNFKLGDVSKKLGEMWKQLPESEKEKYHKLSLEDRDRYESELEEYNNKLHLSSLLQYNKD